MTTLENRLSELERREATRDRADAWRDLEEVTPASATARLMAIADKARSAGNVGGLSVARQALMDVAKLNGLIVETHESVTRSPEERAVRLAELRAERERLTRKH